MPAESLEYRPDDHRREARRAARRSIIVIVGLSFVTQFLITLSTHRWGGFAIPLVGIVLYALLRWRARGIVWRVDERGVHVPPRFDEPWANIDSIVAPGPWHDVVHVRLTGSDDERPVGFPPEYAERIAEIGGKPLR